MRNTRREISHGSLKPSGYYRVKVFNNDFYVHRLVAFTFLGPPPDDSAWQVHHRDGNPSNNSLNNLEYLTPSQNILASFASLSRRCGGVKRSVPVMWKAFGSQSWTTSPSMTQAAAELGISIRSVSRACSQGKVVKGYEVQLADCGEAECFEGEEWRPMHDPISGLVVPGRMVSSLGRITNRVGLISWGYLQKSGYYKLHISFNSYSRVEFIHRFVAFAYLGAPSSRHCCHVNHKDLDKGNNAAENLEYVTQSENMAHFYANRGGCSKSACKPVESRALDSNDGWTQHPSIRHAARAQGVSESSVSLCVNRRRASACGYEFRFAWAPLPAKTFPGEEWRRIDMPAILREKAMRKRYIHTRDSLWVAETDPDT